MKLVTKKPVSQDVIATALDSVVAHSAFAMEATFAYCPLPSMQL